MFIDVELDQQDGLASKSACCQLYTMLQQQ